MLIRNRLLGEACDIVRPVTVCAFAMAVVSAAMAIEGWCSASLSLGAMLGILGGILVYQVHRGVGHLRQRSDVLRAASEDAERHYIDVLRRIVRCVEARDGHWSGHSERVGRLAGRIGERLNLPPRRCELLTAAGQLHDIGLLAVPESVIGKVAQFGVDDYRAVKRHSKMSYDILRPLSSLQDALPAIRHHHERMNGTGYPAGLSGEAIPLGARIIAVADAYDAMTHDRPHRPALTPYQAVNELRRCTPSGYDADCVRALGEVVNLSDLEELLPDPGGAVSAIA